MFFIGNRCLLHPLSFFSDRGLVFYSTESKESNHLERNQIDPSSTYEAAAEKTKVAYDAGCRRFDGAIKGLGGCPMAEDELVGNMPTEVMIEALKNVDQLSIDNNRFEHAMKTAQVTFPL